MTKIILKTTVTNIQRKVSDPSILTQAHTEIRELVTVVKNSAHLVDTASPFHSRSIILSNPVRLIVRPSIPSGEQRVLIS